MWLSAPNSNCLGSLSRSGVLSCVFLIIQLPPREPEDTLENRGVSNHCQGNRKIEHMLCRVSTE